VAVGYFSPSNHQNGSWAQAASEITQENHMRLENKLRKLTSLVDSAFSKQKLAYVKNIHPETISYFFIQNKSQKLLE
jgi:hypothetical protein